jgi:hypothetical protein
LVVEARAGDRWRRLKAREVVVDRCTSLAGGDWTGHSLEWVGDGEALAIEEVDIVGCFGSWRLAAPGMVMGLTDARRKRLGMRQQLVTGGTAHRWL